MGCITEGAELDSVIDCIWNSNKSIEWRVIAKGRGRMIAVLSGTRIELVEINGKWVIRRVIG